MVNNKLPNGWVETYIGELGEVISGGTPSTRNSENFGGYISWLTPADLTGYKDKYISKGKRNITLKGLKKSSARIMPKGTILFSSRAPIGYTVIASNRISTNQGFKSLVPCLQYINSEYIYYSLKNSKQIAESLASGTTFKEISGSNFKKIPILLPPLNEQKRIVAKIEKLFTNLDNSDKQLAHLEKQLKRYRQSVLKSAFEGELTREWRKEQGELESADVLLGKIKEERLVYIEEEIRKKFENKTEKWITDKVKKEIDKFYKNLKPIEESEKPFIVPSEWKWVRLDELSKKITDGTHHTPTYTASGISFISVKDIKSKKINFNNCKYISKKEHEELFKRCNPENNDVLITKSGTIGRTCVINVDRDFSLFVSVALIKPFLKFLNPYYLMYRLDNYIFMTDIQQTIKGGIIKNLHIIDMRQLVFPLFSLEEQNQIVLQIGKHFTMIDKLESVVQTSIKESKRLRQSILKQAFEGKLVEQDSSDESAELLLKKIAKAKAVYAEALKKKRKKR